MERCLFARTCQFSHLPNATTEEMFEMTLCDHLKNPPKSSEVRNVRWLDGDGKISIEESLFCTVPNNPEKCADFVATRPTFF